MGDQLIQRQQCHFDEIASQYYAARKNPRLMLLKKIIWQAAFRNKQSWKLEEPVRSLEAMCGFADGYDVLQENLDMKFEYCGFDYSQAMINYAETSFPQLRFFVQDITTYTSENMYDLIILIGGLHHVYHVAGQAISNLSKVLRKGGIFINLEPTNNNYLLKKIRSLIYRKNNIFDDITEKAFATRELHKLFSTNDLKVIDVLYPGLLAYILWFNPDAFPFLNVGSLSFVSRLSRLESKFLWRTRLAYYASFATLSICQKI